MNTLYLHGLYAHEFLNVTDFCAVVRCLITDYHFFLNMCVFKVDKIWLHKLINC